MPRLFSLIFATLWTFSMPLSAAVIDVGPNSVTCDYTSLQVALAAAQDGDQIRLASGTYAGGSGINFNLNEKSISILGGFDTDCMANPTGGLSVLLGGGNDTVLEISGTGGQNITLKDIQLRGGQDDSDDGGGLSVSGPISVFLIDVSVILNQSERGGGLLLDNGATVELWDGTEIALNATSDAGGGVHCQDGTLRLQGEVSVAANFAATGGGIYAEDCEIELQTSSDLLLITGNDAVGDGGGLYLVTSQLEANGGPLAQILIEDNQAAISGPGAGAGLYLDQSTANLRDVQISNNRAPLGLGGGVFLDGSSNLWMGPDQSECSRGRCVGIVDNTARSAAAFRLQAGSAAKLEGVVVTGNTGTVNAAIASIEGASLELLSVAAIDNSVVSEGDWRSLLHLSDGAIVTARSSTLAGNHAERIINVSGDGSFDGDQLIVWGNDGSIFGFLEGPTSLDCSIVQEIGTLPAGHTGNLIADPQFVDLGRNDFHILPTSPAFDHCSDPATADGFDLDDDIRPFGVAFDAGADEESGGLIFLDGFETGSTSQWSAVVD